MQFIDIHTHAYQQYSDVISIINTYPSSKTVDTPFSIGIHPWYISERNLELDFKNLKLKLSQNNCLAIGECGLDKLTNTEFSLQAEVFKRHIKLSEEYEKPIIIHCVKAFNELIQIKKQVKPSQIWIVHGFSKNIQIAKELIKHGMYISVGSNLLVTKKLQETIAQIPTENILLETDNSNESIKNIYDKFAAIKKQDVKFIQKQINQNFNRIFTL